MFARIRRRFTYANVMATIAVFVALGGTATAAIVIRGTNVVNGSLTGLDVRNGSLTTADVADRSLLARDFRAGQLPRGAQGPVGPQGPQGPQGPAGTNGTNGTNGTDGAPGLQGRPAFVAVLSDARPVAQFMFSGGLFTLTPCAAQDRWGECAGVNVVVPAGKTYAVLVTASTSVYSTSGTPFEVQACTSIRDTSVAFDGTPATLPTCEVGTPPSITIGGSLGARGLSVNRTHTLSGGDSGATYRVALALRPVGATLANHNGAQQRLSAIVSDVTP